MRKSAFSRAPGGSNDSRRKFGYHLQRRHAPGKPRLAWSRPDRWGRSVISVIGPNGAGNRRCLICLPEKMPPSARRIMTSTSQLGRSTGARTFSHVPGSTGRDLRGDVNYREHRHRRCPTSPRGFRFAIIEGLRQLAVERPSILKLGLERRLHDRVALRDPCAANVIRITQRMASAC
jgi:hypothetical protein